jgi:hypothetical protein
MRGIVHPAVQYPAEPLKSETSRTAVPIPQMLALTLAAHVERWPGQTVMTNKLLRRRSTTYLRGSVTTTCGTTSPRC